MILWQLGIKHSSGCVINPGFVMASHVKFNSLAVRHEFLILLIRIDSDGPPLFDVGRLLRIVKIYQTSDRVVGIGAIATYDDISCADIAM